MPLRIKLKAIIGSIILMLFLYSSALKSQCSGCTTVITASASTNFSVNSGQVVCINPGINYTGNITLNGGRLCNQGTVTKITFKSGTLDNYGLVNKTGALSISNSGNVLINCYSNSTFSVSGGITLQSDHIGDSVVVKIFDNGKFTTGTGFTMHNTNLFIYNGISSGGTSGGTGTGGGTTSPPAIFNVGGQLSMGDSTDFRLNNNSGGYFNVSNNLSFNGTGSKKINNVGIFNVNNAVNMSGIANSVDVITINNTGRFNITTNLSAAINNAVVIINNITGAIMTVGQSLTLSKSTNTIINSGLLNVGQDFLVNNGSATNNYSVIATRDIKVNHGRYNNTSYSSAGRFFTIQDGQATNSGTISAVTDFKVNTSTLTNNVNALASASNSFIIQTSSIVNNSGTISSISSMKVITSTLTNNSGGTINSNINFLIQSSGQVINSGTLSSTNDIQLTSSSTLTNNVNAIINSNHDFILQSTSQAVNNSTMMVSHDISISNSTLTNNNTATANHDVVTANSTAVININGYISAGNEFRNIATVNLAQGSLIQTNNYYNIGNNASINGPTSVPDTALYAKILISGFSQNSAVIGGQIIVFDQSLASNSSNANYGFDQVTNPAKIGPAVLFAIVSAGPINPVIVICKVMFRFASLTISVAPSTSICAGKTVTMTAQMVISIIINPPGGAPYMQLITNFGNNAYSWLPAGSFVNPNQQVQTVTPLVTTTYTVNVTYLGCVYTNTITITVISPTNFFAFITGSPEILFPFPDYVNLIGTQTGGISPYTYAWTPNVYFSPGGNLINPAQVNPPVGINYTLTVTDNIGCIATKTINIIPAPYAPLNKKPDGGYYKLVNNKMLFKFDGQYALTGLVYNVYNKNNLVVSSNLVNNLNSSLVVNSGDNRYSFNATSLISGEYYTLEVINEKNEKLYLRFVR